MGAKKQKAIKGHPRKKITKEQVAERKAKSDKWLKANKAKKAGEAKKASNAARAVKKGQVVKKSRKFATLCNSAAHTHCVLAKNRNILANLTTLEMLVTSSKL